MKTLNANGQTYTAERVVKTSDSVFGYTGTDEVFAFRGISDFSGYELDGEWDPAVQTPEQMLSEIQELKKRLTATEKTALALIDFM